jgi:hypothetical protein
MLVKKKTWVGIKCAEGSNRTDFLSFSVHLKTEIEPFSETIALINSNDGQRPQ